MKIKYFLCGVFCTILASCSYKSVTSFYALTVECLGVELDGSQTLLTRGNGKNKKDAIEQAKKNAVREVIFKGIRGGMDGCNTIPIVTEVNAEEKYEEYFNQFFQDGGEYKKFVHTHDKKRKSTFTVSSSTQVASTITVTVLRTQLKEKLKQDNILK